jgi:hypothetical protein
MEVHLLGRYVQIACHQFSELFFFAIWTYRKESSFQKNALISAAAIGNQPWSVYWIVSSSTGIAIALAV